MITLITGAPGAGKSAALVKLLMELAKGRALFVDGIPDLKVPHVPLEDARRWPELVPDGAAVVIDEAQRVWRPAGSAQKVAQDIALLETHRHRGLDFFIVTQHPKLIHSNVRALVGRHVHLRDIGVLGRWWYEWPEAVDPGTWKTAPVKKRYRIDKKTFGLYKSASEHVKPVRSLPPVLLLLLAAVVGVSVLGWMAYKSISGRMGGDPAPVAQTAAVGASGRVVQASSRVVPVSGADLVVSFVPRLSGQPDSAPAYDHLRKVMVMPRIVGGFCQGELCRCYNQQNTSAGITVAECRAWLKATPFDPYRAPVTQSARSAGGGDAQSSGAGENLRDAL